MTVVVTGSAGLVGSAAVDYFCGKGEDVVGIDNDTRGRLFGPDASIKWRLEEIINRYGDKYAHWYTDITDYDQVRNVLKNYRGVDAIIHCAAQPSHDWASDQPHIDFAINGTGTLNMLEAVRQNAPNSVFIHLSTNKVYGDRPNRIQMKELSTRYDLLPTDFGYIGVDEHMAVDRCLHSLFGVSKLAGDMMAQEYGRYYGLKTVILRGGCLTGPAHSGTELHGFLSYLAKCIVSGTEYRVYGYQGKQVRDNIHSSDLADLFGRIVDRPPEPGTVFNVGGGRSTSISIIEAAAMMEDIIGRKSHLKLGYPERVGDHRWYITNNMKLMKEYPAWEVKIGIAETIEEICEAQIKRWRGHEAAS